MDHHERSADGPEIKIEYTRHVVFVSDVAHQLLRMEASRQFSSSHTDNLEMTPPEVMRGDRGDMHNVIDVGAILPRMTAHATNDSKIAATRDVR